MKDKYLIKGVGIGESYMYLTEKDVWGWLKYNPTKPCPDRLADSMWAFLSDEHDSKQDMIDTYRKGVPDMRAMYAMEIGNCFHTIGELIKYVQINKINIVDEAEFIIC